MNDIKECVASTSPYEVFTLLCEKIVKGELVTFNALRSYCAPLPDSPRTEALLRKAFELQRRLYWGFFRDITPTTYPNVWGKVVVPDRKYRFAGDIKRMAMIPDVYMAIIDIHGYTRFCQKNRHNMSMLDILDRVLQNDLPSIASRHGVVSRRASGDEILLLGGSAAEVFEVVFLIARYLSKEDRGKDLSAEANEAAKALPSFQISAGVSGGAKYSQLVITRDGDLSGTIVNTAARLQARANRISPDRTKILLTNVTFQKIKMLPPSARYEFLKAVDFFDTGIVEFKGVNVSVFDTVFLAKEAQRLEYRDRMSSLYDSISQGLWSAQIFAHSLNLMARIVTSSTGGLVDEATGQPIDAGDSISVIQRIKKAQSYFAAERYELAVKEFSELVDAFCRAAGRDAIVTEYLETIRDNYGKIVESFTGRLDRELDEKLDAVFMSQNDRSNFRTLEKHHATFASVREAARFKVPDRRNLWVKTIEESADRLGVSIQSKK
jgi:class 3 adenylate cyclase